MKSVHLLLFTCLSASLGTWSAPAYADDSPAHDHRWARRLNTAFGVAKKSVSRATAEIGKAYALAWEDTVHPKRSAKQIRSDFAHELEGPIHRAKNLINQAQDASKDFVVDPAHFTSQALSSAEAKLAKRIQKSAENAQHAIVQAKDNLDGLSVKLKQGITPSNWKKAIAQSRQRMQMASQQLDQLGAKAVASSQEEVTALIYELGDLGGSTNKNLSEKIKRPSERRSKLDPIGDKNVMGGETSSSGKAAH